MLIKQEKIEISNPGGLVPWMDKEEFGKRSRTRNPLIADLLSRTKYVEKLGTGINRIKKAMQNSNLPEPVFDYNEHNFSTILISEKTVEKTVEKIIQAIQNNPKITQKELQKITGLSRRGVEYNIRKLKEQGKLERIGSPRGGHWKVIR